MVAQSLSLEDGSVEALARLSRSRFVLGLALSAAFIVLGFRLLDLSDIGVALRAAPAEPLVLASAAAAYTLPFWLRAVAWRSLIKEPIETGRLFSILQTSLFLNHLLPLKAGEVARPLMLAGKGVEWPRATATAIV